MGRGALSALKDGSKNPRRRHGSAVSIGDGGDDDDSGHGKKNDEADNDSDEEEAGAVIDDEAKKLREGRALRQRH